MASSSCDAASVTGKRFVPLVSGNGPQPQPVLGLVLVLLTVRVPHLSHAETSSHPQPQPRRGSAPARLRVSPFSQDDLCLVTVRRSLPLRPPFGSFPICPGHRRLTVCGVQSGPVHETDFSNGPRSAATCSVHRCFSGPGNRPIETQCGRLQPASHLALHRCH